MNTAPIDDEIYDLHFYLRRSVRYHMRRAAFFMKWQRFTSFIGVVFGSAAVATFISKSPSEVAIAFALAITVASAFDLVVGTGQHAWLHNDLRKRFLELEGVLVSTPTSNELVADIKHRIRRIEADEPPSRELLNLMARNDIIRADFPAEDASKAVCNIGWLKRATANLVDWDTEKY
ncbi:hypothetical protein [Pseudomonas jilinensis]|uniref:SMODS and SLOG-associating 2TM effector domain-containing protein n=1 Tax=Pseudomonas jilinensis TaxID=2078689 RepID=A0A396RYI2_9PSED|nr:hypothetical protein [Pseudomonas jilinensis]RHW21710.1 hypothetical protein C2846_07095 [Pseudomonas jilinensis]